MSIVPGRWDQDNHKKPVEPGDGGPHDGNMRERLARLEAILPTLATKADVEGVRTDLHKMDAAIVRWMLATVIGLFLGFAGLFFTMQNGINGALDRAIRSTAIPSAPVQPPPAAEPHQRPQRQP